MASSNVTNLQSKNAVLLKLPTFWTSQPQVWFEQAGVQFHIRRATDKYRNEPLPRAGSFTSSHRAIGAFVAKRRRSGIDRRVSLFSDSRFPDSIITIKQQSVSIVFIGNCEQGPPTMRYSKLFRQTQQPDTYVHSRTTVLYPLIFKSKSAYGSFTFLPLRCLEE
ncbi:hypothetical protein T07_516 [Trichinella nelsoni]|uniref:Uncharacterized protein n=1 Tax=Trichinella nelsoni TaxID=6336 RepID=A0A0V0SG16_9BILA|nr:hypothetical protein T07_516 [Trichinella nelsoni]